MPLQSGMLARLLCAAFLICGLGAEAGAASSGSMYRNPILYADYSDPDVIRVGACQCALQCDVTNIDE